jgi:hypothetical protein
LDAELAYAACSEVRKVLSIVLLLSTGPAFAQDCPAPLKPMLRVELYFGPNVDACQP